MYIFTIFDKVSEKAGNIFTTATIGEAERQFRDALENAADGSLFRTHPQDFSLELIGQFDPDKVEIISTEKTTVTKGYKPDTEQKVTKLAEVSA
jgi:hypothetical protein